MDVVTIGETMVLFTPESRGLLRYVNQFSSKIAGAESNVAIGLARLGHQSGWMSKLGNDELGHKILSFIRGEGVDVTQVKLDNEAHTGLFLKEKLTAKETRVQYYRNGSAASTMKIQDLNEEYIAKSNYLHLTGITPALSESCYEMVKEAISIARKHDTIVVFDPNLRRKLWPEEDAKRILLELSAMADIVLPGVGEGEFLFGEKSPEELTKQFQKLGASMVILKLGKEGAYYLSEQEQGYVKGYPVDNVVDSVGAGDGFCAGLLSGLLDELSLQEAVRRANAVGAMVTMVEGDVEGLPDRQRLDHFMHALNQDDVIR